MRFPRHSAALVAALTLAGSVGAAPRTRRAPKTTPVFSQELTERLARAELLAGITEVTGPGLIVTLRPCPHPPKGTDPNSYRVLDQDLTAVLNALRAAGAEALAVSGARQTVAERILVTSAVQSEGEGLLINGVKLLPPYRILAVGAAEAMRVELYRPDGVVKKAHMDALEMIELERVAELVVPACRQTAEPKYARATVPAVTPVAASAGVAPGVEMPRTPASPEPLQPSVAPAVTPPSSNRVVGIVPRTKAPIVREPAKLPPVKPEPPVAKPEAALPNPSEKEPVKERSPATTAKTQPMPVADLGLFGGKGLAKYHAAGCRFGERIDKGERVRFNSLEAARQAGRVPCSICLPDTEHSTSR